MATTPDSRSRASQASATKAERATQQSVFDDWFSVRCVRAAVVTFASVLHADHVAWAKEAGVAPLSVSVFGKTLRARGFESKKNSNMAWIGIALRTQQMVGDA